MSISGIPSPAPLEELKFRGGPNEDVSDFLGAIKRAAIKQDRHLDDKWMVSYAESCLRGDAMEWFDEMGPDVATMDWMSLRKAFLLQFRAAPPSSSTVAATAAKIARASKETALATNEAAEAATEAVATARRAKKLNPTAAKKARAATPTDTAAATDVVASVEAASRAATAAATRAAKAATMAEVTAAELKAAVEKATAAATAATAAAEMVAAAANRRPNPIVEEPPTVPRPVSVDNVFRGIQATCFSKVLFLGNVGVGKSCLLSRQLGRGWVSSTTPTVGIHYETSTRLARFEAGDLVVDKQAFWDASGKDEYRSLIGPYCPGTTRIWIVYDITDQKSFQDVRRWFDLVMQHNSTAKTILRLVGNKCDLHNRRVVQQQQGRDLAKELGISQFYETSAKTNEGIQEMWNLWFETITQFKP
ncbi:GTP-binding protein [Tulasnella sp. JGI-2019a]|nr:GTP-binding protein [Tulasnella sp. JGI-2019a]